MPKGNVLAETGRIVNILPPVDVTGGKTAQCFSLKNHAHASIIFQIGVSAAAPTAVLLNQCTDASGTGATAIPFSVYKQEVAGASHDQLGVRTAVAAAGYAPSANDGIFYVIEIDAAELDGGSGAYLQLQITNGANSVIASAIAILSGARYSGAQTGAGGTSNQPSATV